MANLSKKTYGEGVTKGVDLVVAVYDNAHWEKDGRSGVFVQEIINPDSPIAAGQRFLGLKSVDRGDGQRPDKNVNRTPAQFDAMVAAAGDNVAELRDSKGESVGKVLGVKADIMFGGKEGARYALANSKTFAPSELSVADVDGKTVMDRVFDVQREASAAREAAQEAKGVDAPEAPAVEAEVEEQVEASNEEPQFG